MYKFDNLREDLFRNRQVRIVINHYKYGNLHFIGYKAPVVNLSYKAQDQNIAASRQTSFSRSRTTLYTLVRYLEDR